MRTGICRWGEADDRRAEVPVDDHNHAHAALRYLIATLDRHSISKRRSKLAPFAEEPVKSPAELAAEARVRRYWKMAQSDDPRIWWPMG